MSIFTDKKSNLEAKGFVVQDDNTVLGLNGQPEAGMDAYGQVWFKDEEIEAICNKVEEEATPEEALVAADPVETELVRARNDKGHYIKDDPDTEVNEAWTTKVIKKLKPKKKKKTAIKPKLVGREAVEAKRKEKLEELRKKYLARKNTKKDSKFTGGKDRSYTTIHKAHMLIVDDMDKIPKLGPRKYNLSSKSKKELSSLMSKIKKLLDKK